MRHKDSSRLRHSGNIAAAGLYPVHADTDGQGEKKRGDAQAGTLQAHDGGGVGNGWYDVRGELHEGRFPAPSKELEGSLGHMRRELSA